MDIKLPLLAFFLCLAAVPAAARAPVCTPDAEAIITLNPPRFDSPTIWDAPFADKVGMIAFSGGVELDSGNILAVGQEQAPDYKPLRNIFVELDNRARVTDDRRTNASPGERQTGMLPLKDGGYVIASTLVDAKSGDRKTVRLARYGHDRKFRGDLILKDPAYDYDVVSIAPAAPGRGYFVAVHAVSRRDAADEYGVLYRVSDAAKVAWKRSYRPGVATRIESVASVNDKQTLAIGSIRHEDGRMAGWAMLLNDDGTIVWQNVMPRGGSATLRAAASGGLAFVAVGQVVPFGEDPVAAWAVALDSAGQILWQRYLRAANYNLDARAVSIEPDGRVGILANAAARDRDGEGSDHIRYFTFSPRGELMNDEAFMQGRRASAAQIIAGRNRERLVVATIDAIAASGADQARLITEEIARKQLVGPVLPEAAKTDADALRRQGWVFAATPLPVYDDPCIVKPEKVNP